ncbi:hypothetical protein SAMN05428988_2816 [Chitinophaga sp. YR573]|nr:class I lanthipeptide [Chitinophaga sp. YR573]SEW18136.1 hypothetical protein SAMN05428988_2816 [Chitinophaga sp. YR573]
MKKESVKKLSLGKIKIAKLNTTQLQLANAPTYTGCSLLKCTPPPVEQH